MLKKQLLGNSIYNKGDIMSKIVQTSLVIKKETIFDKISKALFSLFFHEEYEMLDRLDKLLKVKRVKPKNIVIPKEIKKFN